MLQAILFDLDGTLLPMDNDHFTAEYFKRLAACAKGWGYPDYDPFIAGIWAGVKEMVINDGSRSNSEAFWAKMAELFGPQSAQDKPKFLNFYETTFDGAKIMCHPNGLARTAIEIAREKAERLILATNPIFPYEADITRMNWIDLKESDFDLITDYENSCHSKPNPQYYLDIMEQFQLDPAKCLMIGNDVGEDMLAAQKVGMPVYLVSDYLINRGDTPITCPIGTFEEMLNYLKQL